MADLDQAMSFEAVEALVQSGQKLAALKRRGIGGIAAFWDVFAPLESFLRRLKRWTQVSQRFGPRKITSEQQIPMLAAA